ASTPPGKTNSPVASMTAPAGGSTWGASRPSILPSAPTTTVASNSPASVTTCPPVTLSGRGVGRPEGGSSAVIVRLHHIGIFALRSGLDADRIAIALAVRGTALEV